MIIFTTAMFVGISIRVFNHRRMRRDATYIESNVEAVCSIIDGPDEMNPARSGDTPNPETS